MKRIILSLAMCPTVAAAALVGYVDGTAGSRIELHDTAGMCLGNARLAQYVAADGSRIPGCWVAGAMVFVVFLDGDMAQIPMQAIKEAKDI